MSADRPILDSALARVVELVGLTRAERPVRDVLCEHPRRVLLEACRELGVKGVSRARKAALVERVAHVLEHEGAVPLRERAPRPSIDEPRDIPWSYGQDRVTAVAVDPERLYAYWEVTDDALDRARRALDAGVGDARLILRVHDTTGRTFDGTNAHDSCDVVVERDDRQWFVTVGKPGSEAFVELGTRSPTGRFEAIARSKRVDFPRREPAPPQEPEWTTVRVSDGGPWTIRKESPPPASERAREPNDAMALGYFSLVLHAHLPFVRHPDDPTVMEERWLHEAITGTYLPLLRTFEELEAEGVPFRCTVSLSAPLLTMLTDDLLKLRYAEHLDDLIGLAEKEVERTEPEPHYHALARMYAERFRTLRDTWRSHRGDLVRAFGGLQDRGRIELITSTATHVYFPLLDRNRAAMRAQVQVAANLYEQHFGRRTRGMWLGECGYVPGVDEILREAGVRYFFVDTHGLLNADRPPVHGVHAPVHAESGVAAFARDPESSEQVWDARRGYPGDPHYRDFYRDIGFDLPLEYIRPHVHPAGHRMATGLKYHAITHDELHDKWVYDPDAARGRAGLHASHFRGNLEKQVERLAAGMERPPIVVSPYDAELFGHWWFEGPIFLGDVFRQLHHDQDAVEAVTPSDYLDRHPTNQCATPCASSWGRNGYHEQWVNETNAWTLRHVHRAGERMVDLARRHRTTRDPLVRRALNQAARELMLAQSSDWAFILSMGTTVRYAARRFEQHIVRFTRLCEELEASDVRVDALRELERTDNVFPHVDSAIYAT